MASDNYEEPNGGFLPKEQWPHTVDEAVNILLTKLNDSDKETIKNTIEADLIKYHRDLGTYIRNQFGLWKGNMGSPKPFHPEDVSMIIIGSLWKKLNSL